MLRGSGAGIRIGRNSGRSSVDSCDAVSCGTKALPPLSWPLAFALAIAFVVIVLASFTAK